MVSTKAACQESRLLYQVCECFQVRMSASGGQHDRTGTADSSALDGGRPHTHGAGMKVFRLESARRKFVSACSGQWATMMSSSISESLA